MNAAEQYAWDVLHDKQSACKWVRLACQRQVDDLDRAHERGLHFDRSAAEHALIFFKVLKHSKGEHAGQTIILEPWEQFLLWVLFGWKRSDGTRRFRVAFVSMGRKNGKSTIGAGVGLYLFIADHEPGAEVYSASTKRDQSRITHAEATRMVRKSPMLRKRITIYKDNLHVKDSASKYEPLGADSDTTDGLNVHGIIADEIHAWRTRELWDVLDTATSARRQPLIFGITTAGFDRQSLCWNLNDKAQKVLEGTQQDDTFFALIYTLDEGDDWQDEATWIKANPNLGISKKLDQMQQRAENAKNMPSALNAFLRLDLNMWTQSETKWMNMSHWKSCGQIAVVEKDLQQRVCYTGLDLASNIDLAAFGFVFPPLPGDLLYRTLMRFWLPEENLLKRVHDDRVPYDVWAKAGYITLTPGNVIDQDFIFAQIETDAKAFRISEVAFDRWGSAGVIPKLQNMGLTCVEFGQGFASMNPPMKELERLVMQHQLAHGNNPVLTWMADNVVATQDPAGNIKPDKSRSREKIDGIVALIMALDRAMRNRASGPGHSVYDTRGIRTI